MMAYKTRFRTVPSPEVRIFAVGLSVVDISENKVWLMNFYGWRVLNYADSLKTEPFFDDVITGQDDVTESQTILAGKISGWTSRFFWILGNQLLAGISTLHLFNLNFWQNAWLYKESINQTLFPG